MLVRFILLLAALLTVGIDVAQAKSRHSKGQRAAAVIVGPPPRQYDGPTLVLHPATTSHAIRSTARPAICPAISRFGCMAARAKSTLVVGVTGPATDIVMNE
jgi:hypothetical protein